MSKLYYKKYLYLLILISTLFFVPVAMAAYERFSPGETVTLGEFVYNDDFTPTTTPCIISIFDPADNIVVNNVLMTASTSGWHYYSYNGATALGTWPATMSCGSVSNGDLAKLDKTFVIGYANASTTDIASAVWNNSERSLSTTTSLVASIWEYPSRGLNVIGNITSGVWDVATSTFAVAGSVGKHLVDSLDSTISGIASSVWLSTTRTLTSRLIGAGEYLAGVSASYLVTQVASEDQATNLQSDVTSIKNNVATLITEVGTGNITGIKTKTDFIAWGDVTGLVTSSGQIKAKTDTIDWANVTAIQADTDTIAWADITGIKDKTDTIVWGDITTIKNNAATLITQIGTGNIAAIKTSTDAIAWGYITGLVTSNGLIKAKTDTIDWANITAIQTDTDTIAWADITGIKAKTDTIDWTDITTIKNNVAIKNIMLFVYIVI